MNKSNFQIINASAGSGKTHTLVLEYLKILFKNDSSISFRHLLALTFTNKAVNEMKSRILKILNSLSNPPSFEKHIVTNLCEFLNVTEKELSIRASHILKKIILVYGSFDIITLDKFSHRLVRTYAMEFKLPYNFEVVLDPEDLLNETVDSIIEEVGTVKILSKLLLEFSLNKVLNDKDWDIQKDLHDFIRLLLNENDLTPITDIKNKSLEDLKAESKLLYKAKEESKKAASKYAKDALDFINKKGIKAKDFKREHLYNHFEDAKNGVFNKLYDNQLEVALIGEKKLYNKTLLEEKKLIINKIQSQLLKYYYEVKKCVGEHLLIEKTLNSWTPRMLLQLMELRLNALQDKKQVRLLGEFNSKINHLIENEPVPYIYERLGDRYQHYFLDEFQDTSKLQWTNLIPLIGNALESQDLSGEAGSLLLVGDPKQAIYRWRGGNMEQYVDLINNSKNPFQIGSELLSLNENFRSGDKIVSFNNDFFLALSKIFENEEYQNIYGNGSQQEAHLDGGYVRIETISKGVTKESSVPLYISKILNIVREVLAKGYKESDIAILVRKKDQVALIGNALSQDGFKILSSESILVAQSKKVQFLIAILKLSIQPNISKNHKIILDFIWEILGGDQNMYHEFAKENLHLDTMSFLKTLQKYFEFNFKIEFLKGQTIYEAVNYILTCFPQIDISEAYLHFFIEDIYEFSKIKSVSISSYLDYWEGKSKKLTITMPEGLKAIKLMTIHQAKGLEFPVVILPFMDTPIFPLVNEKIWFPFSEGKLKTIKWGWFNFSKELQHYGNKGKQLYKEKCLDHQLDAFNVLYVAMTRAVDAMFIISKDVDDGNKTYAHWFKNYIFTKGQLLDSSNPFEQGIFNLRRQIIKDENKLDFENVGSNLPINVTWKKRLILDSSEDKIKDSKEWGILIHDLLAKVTTSDLIPHIFKEANEKKSFPKKFKRSVEEKVWEVVRHPELKKFYDGEDDVLCEQELLMPSGPTLRPDRVNFSKNGRVSVLDYKTSDPKEADIEQIKTYKRSLMEFGYNKIDSYLVYINSDIQVVRIN